MGTRRGRRGPEGAPGGRRGEGLHITRGIERRGVRAGVSPGVGRGRVRGAVGCDPLDDARALLALTRLLYRTRVAAARHGVLPRAGC